MYNKFGKFDWAKNKIGSEAHSRIKSSYYNPRNTLQDIAKEYNTTERSLHNHFDREKRDSIKDAYDLEVKKLKDRVGVLDPFGKEKPLSAPVPAKATAPTRSHRPGSMVTDSSPREEMALQIKDEDVSLKIYNKSNDLMLKVLDVAEARINKLVDTKAEDLSTYELKQIMGIVKDCNVATKDQKELSGNQINVAVLVNKFRQKDLKTGRINEEKLLDFIDLPKLGVQEDDE